MQYVRGCIVQVSSSKVVLSYCVCVYVLLQPMKKTEDEEAPNRLIGDSCFQQNSGAKDGMYCQMQESPKIQSGEWGHCPGGNGTVEDEKTCFLSSMFCPLFAISIRL